MDNSSDLFRRLEQLNAIGVALSKERDINRLLESMRAVPICPGEPVFRT